jgi:hypothetical protein
MGTQMLRIKKEILVYEQKVAMGTQTKNQTLAPPSL